MIAIICPPRNIIENKQTVYYDVHLTITTVKTGTMYWAITSMRLRSQDARWLVGLSAPPTWHFWLALPCPSPLALSSKGRTRFVRTKSLETSCIYIGPGFCWPGPMFWAMCYLEPRPLNLRARCPPSKWVFPHPLQATAPPPSSSPPTPPTPGCSRDSGRRSDLVLT